MVCRDSSPCGCRCRSSRSPWRCTTSTLLLVLVVVAVVVPRCSSQWVDRPEDALQHLGLNVTFNCSVGPGHGGVAWSKIDDKTGEPSLLFVNTDSWNTNATRRMRVVAMPGGGYSLTLTSLQRSDDARYQCTVRNSALSHTARLTVLVNPGEPELSINTAEQDMREGRTVQLNCTSTGGNPVPSVTWYRNGSPLTDPPSTLTSPTRKFGATVGTLTWTLTAADHMANFSCSVSTPVIPGSRVYSPVKYYRVQYAPIISLSSTDVPPSASDTLIVVENATLTLSCTVNAYPPVDVTTVTWYKDAALAGRGSALLIEQVSVSDTATYTCSAYNFAERNASVHVTVHYAPRLRPVVVAAGAVLRDGQVSVRENDAVNMTCHVDAVPPPTTSALSWYRNGSMAYTGQFYVIPSVRRRDAWTYECRTSNTMSPSQRGSRTGVGRATINVVVMYVPGRAAVTVPRAVVVRDNVTLHCSVTDPGVPASVLTWSKLNDVSRFPNGTTLRLANVKLSHTGIYSCTPVNEVGSGQSASVSLDVIEPPHWTENTTATRSVLVNQTRQLSFHCAGRGNPAPFMRWTKDGQTLDGSGTRWYTVNTVQRRVDIYSSAVTSTLSWQGLARSPYTTSLRPDDEGRYECRLSVNVSTVELPAAQSMQLIVHYGPIMSLSYVKMAVDAHQSAKLVCSARGWPAPTMTWSRQSMSLSDITKYLVVARRDTGGQFPVESVLNISNIQQGDLGIYSCSARNDMGVNVTHFNLTVKTYPDTPQNLQVVSATWESIELQWTPGFDGGYEQEFVVVVSSRKGPIYRSTNSSSIYNVTGLNPSTHYAISVYARNKLGDGEYSSNVSAITDALLLERPVSVVYNAETQSITFQSPTSSHLCLRVRLLSDSTTSWTTQLHCPAVKTGSVKLRDDVDSVKAVEVSFCVERRPDVCGQAQNATIESSDSFPLQTIIIVACVCGGVLLILLIILIVLLCRRCRRHSDTKKRNTPEITLRPISSAERLHRQNGNGHLIGDPSMTGYDNPVIGEPDVHSGGLGNDFTSTPLNNHDMARLNDAPPPYYPASSTAGSVSNVSDSPNPSSKRVIREVVV